MYVTASIIETVVSPRTGVYWNYFKNAALINGAIRKNAGARWSRTNKCWYVPLSKASYNKLFFALKGKAVMEQTELYDYMLGKKPAPDKKTVQSTGLVLKKNTAPVQHRVDKKQTGVGNHTAIHPVNGHILPAMEQVLILRSYSPSTVRTYINEVGVFLKTLRHHPADNLETGRIKDYLQYCSEKLGLTENTLHSRMNALKFYYEQVLKKDKFFWDIPRPKKAIQLPKVLSKEEMIRLLKAIENMKHKTMLCLAMAVACG